MKLKIKKLNEKAIVPQRATSGSAGLDLSACIEEDIVLAPGEIKLIPTGLSAAPDNENCALMIYPRSGLASKHGIALANCVGVVDSDYRGEWNVPLINWGQEPYTIHNGDRIAQVVFASYVVGDFELTESIDSTERGAGGFGHTGVK